jgi:hypothetical protein
VGGDSVSPGVAQELANRGMFVLGVARNHDLSESGHIAIVVPTDLPHRPGPGDGGNGPWVRDAQSPRVSVKAGVHRFVSANLVSPIWAVWQGPIDDPAVK